jgi:hypothetical protein
MATNKSSSLYWLTVHVLTYTSVTMIGWFILFAYTLPYMGERFSELIVQSAGLTFITHWVTDFITSRITSNLYKKEKYFEFFAVIGLDQFVHATTLLLTYGYLFS